MQITKEEFLTALANSSVAQEIALDFVINSDWQEIKPTKPMKIEKRFQRIRLEIKCQQKTDLYDWNWMLPDGTLISPEIQIVDEFGNVFQLEGGQANVHPGIEFELPIVLVFARPESLPDDRVYGKIRIRNDQLCLS